MSMKPTAEEIEEEEARRDEIATAVFLTTAPRWYIKQLEDRQERMKYEMKSTRAISAQREPSPTYQRPLFFNEAALSALATALIVSERLTLPRPVSMHKSWLIAALLRRVNWQCCGKHHPIGFKGGMYAGTL